MSSPSSFPRDVCCPKCGSARFHRVRTHVIITTPGKLRQTGPKHVTAVLDWPHEDTDDTALTDIKWHCAQCFHELDLSRHEVDYDG